jgi:tRNA acetyltransferase TAN1
LKKFNLIISSSRFREEDAQDEIMDLLEMFGDPDCESEITEIKGIIVVKTTLEPLLVIDKLKELVASEPWQIRYVLRVMPIEVVVPTDIDSIREEAKELASKRIKNVNTFRITVEKRHSPLASMDVINAIAGEVGSKVDLEDPDWIVLVEIIGVHTGISIIEPDQIFSSIVEKRGE